MHPDESTVSYSNNQWKTDVGPSCLQRRLNILLRIFWVVRINPFYSMNKENKIDKIESRGKKCIYTKEKKRGRQSESKMNR